MSKIINGFFGPWRFLSNFELHPVVYKNITFPSNENAFQYFKGFGVMDLESSHMRRFYEAVEVEANGKTTILPVYTPKEAKKYGKPQYMKLRPDWDTVVEGDMTTCELLMYELNYAKYSSFPMKVRLLDTDDAVLIEGNYWHDNKWGDCQWSGFDRQTPCLKCINIEGQNKLGKILMRVRHAYKTFEKDNEKNTEKSGTIP